MSTNTGTVKKWDSARCFGFIQRPGEPDMFVHKSGIAGAGRKYLVPGDKVSFEIGKNHKGPTAINVVINLEADAAK